MTADYLRTLPCISTYLNTRYPTNLPGERDSGRGRRSHLQGCQTNCSTDLGTTGSSYFGFCATMGWNVSSTLGSRVLARYVAMLAESSSYRLSAGSSL